MDKIKIGKIVNTIGLNGQLKFLLLGTNDTILKTAKKLYIGNFDEKFECEMFSKKSGSVYSLKLLNYNDINDVEKFKNCDVYIEHNNQNIDINQFFVADLVGCQIFFDGNNAGTVTDVENFGASDILVFEQYKKEFRVPFVDEYIEQVDTKNKQIFASDKFLEGVV